VGVIPLHAPAEEDGDEERGSVVGAIIAEQINNAEIGDPLRQRTEVVARHGAAALSNAIAHSSVPLLPVFRAAGRVAALARPANLSRTILALGLVVAVIAALLLVPADFTLEGRGELQPLTRQDIFAPIDGMVIEVRAEHGKSLNQGDVVARMLNTEVGMRLTELRGQLLSREKRRASIQRRLLGGERLTRDEESRLNGELLEVVEEITSLKKQIHLQEQQRRHLDVESPLTGQVATLHVRKRLDRRTLKQGQVMMTVYNPGGGWELILHMPESRMGHIAAAQQASKRGLPVSFMLATHPGETFTGRVKEIHTTANQTAGQPGTVPILVSLEESKLPELRPGTTVTAKVHCGQRALGYVWFHDVIDFVKGKVLF